MKNLFSVASLFLALLAAGCGNAEQKSAYDRALALEQRQSISAETAPALVAEYQKVIRFDSTSSWAKKARERIATVQARAAADELHKNVFQEHGVD